MVDRLARSFVSLWGFNNQKLVHIAEQVGKMVSHRVEGVPHIDSGLKSVVLSFEYTAVELSLSMDEGTVLARKGAYVTETHRGPIWSHKVHKFREGDLQGIVDLVESPYID